MNKNIFQKLNEIVKGKTFKFIASVVFLIIIFYVNFDFKRIDKDKVSSVFSYLFKKNKDASKNITDIIDAKYDTMIYPKEDSKHIKKKLVPDSEIRKDLQVEETLNIITNAFLKLRKVNENYEARVKNRQINKVKQVKYGDYIYYSSKAKFLDSDAKGNESRFYLLVKKGDSISDKLVGKKVGQSVDIYYYDMYKGISSEDKKKIKDGFDKAFENINKKYGENGKKVVDIENIKYAITLLDFIPEKLVKELSLED